MNRSDIMQGVLVSCPVCQSVALAVSVDGAPPILWDPGPGERWLIDREIGRWLAASRSPLWMQSWGPGLGGPHRCMTWHAPGDRLMGDLVEVPAFAPRDLRGILARWIGAHPELPARGVHVCIDLAGDTPMLAFVRQHATSLLVPLTHHDPHASAELIEASMKLRLNRMARIALR
jgi:hypothetical protein